MSKEEQCTRLDQHSAHYWTDKDSPTFFQHFCGGVYKPEVNDGTETDEHQSDVFTDVYDDVWINCKCGWEFLSHSTASMMTLNHYWNEHLVEVGVRGPQGPRGSHG